MTCKNCLTDGFGIIHCDKHSELMRNRSVESKADRELFVTEAYNRGHADGTIKAHENALLAIEAKVHSTAPDKLTEILVDSSYDRGRNEGHEQGNKQGYDIGYAQCKDDVLQAWSKGYAQCKKDNKQRHIQEGFDDGYATCKREAIALITSKMK